MARYPVALRHGGDGAMHEDTFPASAARAATTLQVAASFAITLGVVALVLGATAVQGRLAGLGIDDAFYLLRADQYFGRLDGEPRLAALLATRTYPPLYPLLLGLFGGGSESLLAAYVVNAACVVLWVACLLAWLLRQGATPLAAALLACAAAFAPATLYHAPTLWSEHLFMVFALAAVAVLERPRSDQAFVFAGALVGLAVLTRSAGIALVVAFAIQLLARRPRGAFAAITLAALPLLERLLHPGGAYEGELERVAAQGLDAVLARVAASASGLWLGWRLDWSMAVPPAAIGPALLLVAAAIGWVGRLRAWKLDAIWLPVSLAMLLLWGFPGQAPRFLYPLCPVVLVHAWLGVGMLARRWIGRGAFARRWFADHALQAVAGAALALAIVVPAALALQPRRAVALPPELAPFRRTHLWLVRPVDELVEVARATQVLLDDMRVVRERTPADACVFTRAPGVLMVHARRTPYLLRWTRNEELAAALRDTPCEFAYLDPARINGSQDRVTLEGLGLRVLHASPHPDAQRGAEPVGVLVAFPLSPRG